MEQSNHIQNIIIIFYYIKIKFYTIYLPLDTCIDKSYTIWCPNIIILNFSMINLGFSVHLMKANYLYYPV